MKGFELIFFPLAGTRWIWFTMRRSELSLHLLLHLTFTVQPLSFLADIHWYENVLIYICNFYLKKMTLIKAQHSQSTQSGIKPMKSDG